MGSPLASTRSVLARTSTWKRPLVMVSRSPVIMRAQTAMKLRLRAAKASSIVTGGSVGGTVSVTEVLRRPYGCA